MTNITKAAKQALAELADWHWSQATTLRKAACTSAMDKPEPGQSSLSRMADWHDTQKSIIRVALQDKVVEPMTPEQRGIIRMFVSKLCAFQSKDEIINTTINEVEAHHDITAKVEGVP